jgi:hypothetical protein
MSNPPVGPSPQLLPPPVKIDTGEINKADPAGAEYRHVLSFFKYLVTLTTTAITILLAIGAFLFYSNLREVREDAKQEATRVATVEARERVAIAFDEKNINAMILSAAEKKVGSITDRLIEQQLTAKLQPLQQRIALIGRISECEMRMRMGFRAGLDELNDVLGETRDLDILRFSRATLSTTTDDFETRLREDASRNSLKGMAMLQNVMLKQGRPQQSVASSLHDVVQLIRQETDLNIVALAFGAFRELTGENVKMFDFAAVTKWCSQNQGKC